MGAPTPYDLAERVAEIARSLGIEIALIGANALAIYGYVRATDDIDFASVVDPAELSRLRVALEQAGLHATLNLPDDDDRLGGVLRIWIAENAEGEPVDPIDVVNFCNPLRPVPLPARDFIREALELSEKPALRYVRLPHLIMLKLYAGARRDLADVVDVLTRNPKENVEEIRELCKRYGLNEIDQLIAEAEQNRQSKQ